MHADIGSVNCLNPVAVIRVHACVKGANVPSQTPPALIPTGDSQLRLGHGDNLWQDDSYSFKTATAESGIQQSESTVKFVVCLLL